MFMLSEKDIIDRPFLKSDCIRWTPPTIVSAKRVNLQFFIDIPRNDSVVSLLDSYLELHFDVTVGKVVARFVAADNIRVFNLSPIAGFSENTLSSYQAVVDKILSFLLMLK